MEQSEKRQFLMELSKKLKFIRSYRCWTQENVAEKLGISTYAYAKIERGGTDVNFSRLKQIAQVMGIDLSQLFGLDEKNIFNLTCDHSTHYAKIDNRYVKQSGESYGRMFLPLG
ncbi:MAG: helix-turn-helix transcriptional regulator [Pseudomonadota bacterium]